jgi:NitT/TauT family transport system substrate-binding protein
VEKQKKEVYDLVDNGKVLAELHLSKVGGGSKMPAAMERGEIDVGLGGIPAVMFFVDKGAPFKILCPLNVDGDMLLLRPELPADDWAGFVRYVQESETPVKIGYKAPVAVAKLVLEGALDAEGIPYAEEGVPGGVELVNLRGGGKIVPSLEKGMVDGAVINEPFGSIAEHKGVAKIVSLLSELPPEGRWHHHPCCCICATEDAISKNRRALVALLKLVHHTTDFIHANPETAARLAAEWTANEPAVEAASVPNIVYTTSPDEAYREGMKTWFEIMKETEEFTGILADLGWEESFALGHDLTLYEEATSGN